MDLSKDLTKVFTVAGYGGWWLQGSSSGRDEGRDEVIEAWLHFQIDLAK